MKIRLTYRELTDDEIISVKCPECEQAVGEWCVSIREPNLLINRLHGARVRLAYHRAQAKDYSKARRRLTQIRQDVEKFNAERHELAQWIVGGQLYVWLREYGSILWEVEREKGN